MQTLPPFVAADKDNLKAHVTALTKDGPRYKTDKGVGTALTYIEDTLKGYGYTVTRDAYGAGAYEVNLLCELAGTSASGGTSSTSTLPVLEVGAHWDSVDKSPGADDNASGVAGVLELARMLRADVKGGHSFRRTVRFCLFGGEEDQPSLCTGSRYHVSRLTAAPLGVIVLEMIGYKSTASGSQKIPASLTTLSASLSSLTTGDFIAAVGIDGAGGFLSALSTGAKAQSLSLVPLSLPASVKWNTLDIARSDHSPYWAKGWNGVMVTDTAEFRNPNYHQPTDVLGTLDFDFAAKVTGAVAEAVRGLAA